MQDNFESLREPMNMPNPRFPIKVHQISFKHKGTIMFSHHWHQHLEFLYIQTGNAIVECSSKPIHVQAGDLIVVNSNELHYGINCSDNLCYYALIADTALLHSQYPDAAEVNFIAPIAQNRLQFHNLIRNNTVINDSFLSIVNELDTKSHGYELSVKSEIYRLLTLLIRGHVATLLSNDEHSEWMKNIKRFDPVLQHIDTYFHTSLNVDQLAQLAGLSRFHFSRVFKELTGRTVTEYVTATRLDKAEYMLRHSSLTVSEIAAATGFNDIYYFSRTFKKHKKTAPSSMRRPL